MAKAILDFEAKRKKVGRADILLRFEPRRNIWNTHTQIFILTEEIEFIVSDYFVIVPPWTVARSNFLRVCPGGTDSFLVALLISCLVKRKMNCFAISRSIFSSLRQSRKTRQEREKKKEKLSSRCFNRDASASSFFMGAALFNSPAPLMAIGEFVNIPAPAVACRRSNCYKALCGHRHPFEIAARRTMIMTWRYS